MKRPINSLLFMALLAGSALTQAQLYKSVGPDGKVTYSDTPPASAAKVEAKSFNSSNINVAGMPYELAQAVKNHPVTLYSGDKCPPCDDARKFLKTRGIPFSEKTVSSNADIEKLRQAGGDIELPLLLIGRSKQKGFELTSWSGALSAAGYPETNKLPANYRAPEPQAAAPEQKTTQIKHTENNTPAEVQQSPQPAAGNAPPGFRF